MSKYEKAIHSQKSHEQKSADKPSAKVSTNSNNKNK